MNFFSKIFKNSNSQNNCFISLDIGSEVVKALVFSVDKKQEKVFVIGFGQEQQYEGNMRGDVIKNFDGVVSACKKAISNAKLMAKKSPEKIIIGINGEFIKGLSVSINYKRDNSKVKIDTDEIKKIIYEVQKKVFDKIREESSEANNHLKLTNATIVDSSIDGYRVMSPIGFKGSEIEFKIFNSFLRNERFEIIKSIAKKLKLDLMDMVSEPYAVAMSIGVKDNTKFNAILVDIGGKTTNVAIIWQGNVEGVRTFNVGGRDFTKSLANKFNISFSQAEELKIKYSNKQLDDKMSEKIKNISSHDCDLLFTGVELSLNEFSNSNLLPCQILLYGGGSKFLHIDEIMSKLFIKKSLSFPSNAKINFINIENITNIVDKTGKLNCSQYVNSASLANFVLDLKNEDDVLNKILRDLIQSVK